MVGDVVCETVEAVEPEPVEDAEPVEAKSTLERHKDYPCRARERSAEGTVTVAFVIDRGGRLLDFRTAQSSSSDLLDETAEAMLRAAESLPAMPGSQSSRSPSSCRSDFRSAEFARSRIPASRRLWSLPR